MKLSQFISHFKSENNEIFNKILAKEENKWKEKYWWIFLPDKKEKELLAI